MTADLTKNILGKEVKIPQDNVSERAETVAFLEGVMWVVAHLYEASRRVRDDQRGTVEVEGKPPIEVITESGNPQFAKQLVELAETISQCGLEEAHKRFQKFDPIPEPSKRGESTGL
jgi:hypothetical protein